MCNLDFANPNFSDANNLLEIIMGFVSANSAPLFSIRYSAFLGAMYLLNEDSAAAIKAVKAEIGEDEVKKGFTGNTGATAKARDTLRNVGVKFVQGRKTPYLSLTVSDDDGKYNLSVSVAGRGTQMLIRKLANAKIGEQTEIGLFATYGQREGADRAYAEHGATLKQSNAEVKGIDPKESLSPTVEAAVEALKAAGVDDKETISRRRAAVELQFHVSLLQDIESKFKTFYAEREQRMDDAAPASNPSTDEFNEHMDDVPY
jgi:hypothetical protein